MSMVIPSDLRFLKIETSTYGFELMGDLTRNLLRLPELRSRVVAAESDTKEVADLVAKSEFHCFVVYHSQGGNLRLYGSLTLRRLKNVVDEPWEIGYLLAKPRTPELVLHVSNFAIAFAAEHLSASRVCAMVRKKNRPLFRFLLSNFPQLREEVSLTPGWSRLVLDISSPNR